MASALVSKVETTEQKILGFDFDPGVTSLVDIGWESFANFGSFLVMFFRTIGTGATALNILSNTAADGSGTDFEVKANTYVGGEPDLTGDYVFDECLAEECNGNIGISAQVSVATGTDEAVIIYVMGRPRFSQLDLTADSIA